MPVRDKELFNGAVKDAFHAFMRLTDYERGTVMAWFCAGCYRYLAPGEHCHCQNDD